MTVLNRGALAFVVATSAIALANCSGGGSGPSGPSGPNPTPIPIHSATPTASAAPTLAPTSSPTTSASPKHSPQPTPTPTVGPTASPTASPSATPTPEPTATPACHSKTDPHDASVQLTGSQQTIEIPCFTSYRANVTLPQNNGGDSSPITLHLASSDDKTLGAPSDSAAGTPLFYESVKPSNPLILTGTAPTITGDIDSEQKISPNHIYAVDVFFEGAQLVPTITGIVPTGHDLTFTITLPQGSTFPGGTPVQVVLYQSS